MNNVSYKHQDRQWDCRFNIGEEGTTYVSAMQDAIKKTFEDGKLRYILVSGIEIGTQSEHDDYQRKHVHVAAIFHNPISKAAILKNWGIDTKLGYYLVPRNRDLPYSGWRNHHIKVFSKVDPTTTILFEGGELPNDNRTIGNTKRSTDEKKRKIDEILPEMRQLLQEGKDEECFHKYPRTYIQYGEKIKSLLTQTKGADRGHFGDPNIWLWGFPGTGKTSLFQLIYGERAYKKDLNNRFFDLYNQGHHTHIILEDLDHANVDKLGIQFLKTLCDEAGFPIDQKYKTPLIARATCLVTSNFTIDNVVPEGKGVEETKQALYRRFWTVRVDELHRVLGVHLIPKYERNLLKAEGINDVRRIYITWDYYRGCPTGQPLPTEEEFQKMIRNAYYNLRK